MKKWDCKKEDFNVGDKVKHKFRENKYQNCKVVDIEDGCNGGIIVECEDGFYGQRDTSRFCPQDLLIIMEMIDKNFDVLEVGDTVNVDDTDTNLDFQGTVTGTHGSYIVVEDMEGNSFCVTSKDVELEDLEN